MEVAELYDAQRLQNLDRDNAHDALQAIVSRQRPSHVSSATAQHADVETHLHHEQEEVEIKPSAGEDIFVGHGHEDAGGAVTQDSERRRAHHRRRRWRRWRAARRQWRRRRRQRRGHVDSEAIAGAGLFAVGHDSWLAGGEGEVETSE